MMSGQQSKRRRIGTELQTNFRFLFCRLFALLLFAFSLLFGVSVGDSRLFDGFARGRRRPLPVDALDAVDDIDMLDTTDDVGEGGRLFDSPPHCGGGLLVFFSGIERIVTLIVRRMHSCTHTWMNKYASKQAKKQSKSCRGWSQNSRRHAKHVGRRRRRHGVMGAMAAGRQATQRHSSVARRLVRVVMLGSRGGKFAEV